MSVIRKLPFLAVTLCFFLLATSQTVVAEEETTTQKTNKKKRSCFGIKEYPAAEKRVIAIYKRTDDLTRKFNESPTDLNVLGQMKLVNKERVASQKVFGALGWTVVTKDPVLRKKEVEFHRAQTRRLIKLVDDLDTRNYPDTVAYVLKIIKIHNAREKKLKDAK